MMLRLGQVLAVLGGFTLKTLDLMPRSPAHRPVTLESGPGTRRLAEGGWKHRAASWARSGAAGCERDELQWA